MVEITLALAGDTMLGRGVDSVLHRELPEFPWGNMLPEIRSADLFFLNLECAITGSTERGILGGPKRFYFRSAPKNVGVLKTAGVDVVSLANNHICDFGHTGLLETVHVLDMAGIAHAGVGANFGEASRAAIVQSKGQVVAVVGFADDPAAWAAGEDTPGFNYTSISVESENFDHVRSAVEAARKLADYVVFSIHWGPNMRDRPINSFKVFARGVIDSGVDLFWGHSAHVPQGIEVYAGRPILYDTGDFVDDYAIDPYLRNDLSALFRIHIENGHTRLIEAVPTRIEWMQVNRASGADREWFSSHFADACREMGTEVEDDGDVLRVDISAQD